LTTNPFTGPYAPRRSDRHFDFSFGLIYLAILVALCLLAPQVALSQTEAGAVTNALWGTNVPVEANAPAETGTGVTMIPPGKQRVASEIAESGMISYGNYRIFGAAARCNIWEAGVEYDRHSWGYLVKAQMDYVVEALPFVLLSEPVKADFWGNPESPYQQLVHGVGLSPFGFRMLWRSNMKVKPFLIGKAGVIAFPKKILSPESSYANFNFQGDFGVQIRLTDRTELRVDPVEYFHVSNGYLAASNPGFDELGAKIGISYHLGKQGR
jgi:hypothetical protein